METGKVYLDDRPNGGVIVGHRLRGIDPEKVEVLAKSMAAIGLQTPISVWSPDDQEVHLVAGAHRLAAAIKLGWDEIDCVYVSLSEIDRRRWEIAENLHRSELTVLQRDEHVAEWIRLTEEASRIFAQTEQKIETQPLKRGRPSVGISTAARELGIEKEDARRAVKVAALTEEAKEVAREVGLDDNRSALLEAAKKGTPEEQVETIKEIAERKVAQKPRPKQESPKPDPVNVQWTAEDEASYGNLLDAWEKATPAARNQFIRECARMAA